MKKGIILLIVVALIMTIFSSVVNATNKDDLYLSSGKTLETLGVLQGNDDGNLMLDKKLSRQDMVVLVSRLYKEENKAKTFLIKPKFTDLNSQNEFYHSYIAWSVDKGLIKGMTSDIFGYGRNVTVQQFQTVLLRVLGYEEESRLWSTVPEIATKLGIMEGLEINPKSELNRGQMAVMTLNTLKLTKKGATITIAEVLNLKIN